MDNKEAKAMIESAISFSDASETEVLLYSGQSALTRFANNVIHQNVSTKDHSLSVRVAFGKKVGFASTNSLEKNALRDVVMRASEIAKHQKEDPEYPGLQGPQQYAKMNCYFDKTAKLSPEDRAKAISVVVENCKKKKLNSAGAFDFSEGGIAIGNSKGLFGFHNGTTSSFTVTVMGEDSSGWAEHNVRDVSKMDAEKVGNAAIDKAVLSKNPVAIEPGDYTVVLEANAVSELVAFLAWIGFSALSVQEGKSFMAGKFGQKITGENVTIYDDAFDAGTYGMPFDFEGTPKDRIALIENGVAKNVVYDLVTAKKDGKRSTGHALPQPNIEGPMPVNLVIGTGTATLDEMIASTKKGVLITRFWYNRVVDAKKTIITGMTRDGTFLIENGKLTRGIKNMRFNESVLGMLSNAEMIGKTAELTTGVVTPPMKISKFHFTGITEF
ncbi:MAG: TldD/PmbA family protein [Candidatus Eisenbacteria bacterium]|nr:TldD/PmbA family protein [Candidatus Eisenbacteria bacterium]